MISLPQITLIALTNKDFDGHKKALDKSCEGIEFGAVKIIWDDKIKSIDDWNRKVIQDLWKYVDTTHALLVHADGYVINPHLWKDEWMELDYIGSPWPLPTDDYSYRDERGQIQRVGNSVSLRSKQLMKLASLGDWRPYYGNTNEDGFICCHNRQKLEAQGMKFATFEQALDFGKEWELPEHNGRDTFLFHSTT